MRSMFRKPRKKRAPMTDEQKVVFKTKMRAARKEHDGLEKYVQKLAFMKYRVRLYKSDATARVMKNGKLACNTTPGFPDLFGPIPPTGRLLMFEIKVRSATQRIVQKEVTLQCIEAGALGFIIRNLDEADQVLMSVLCREQEAAERAKL